MRGFAFLLCAALWTQAPYERIVNADREPGNWLTYSRNYQGRRFSPLAQITTANATNLKVKWGYQFEHSRTEVSPIIIDGVMYVTGPNSAAALDARRGPAVLDDKLFVTTVDCYLIALDLKSGIERWTRKVEDYKPGYSMTVAPLAMRGKVVVGVAGGEAGIRGFVDAYDAKNCRMEESKSGRRAVAFTAIGPGPPLLRRPLSNPLRGSKDVPMAGFFRDSIRPLSSLIQSVSRRPEPARWRVLSSRGRASSALLFINASRRKPIGPLIFSSCWRTHGHPKWWKRDSNS
jgi:hypothetical protein